MTEAIATEVPGQVHFIGGKFVASASGQSFDVINPATEEVVTTAARGDADDIAKAVSAAKETLGRGRVVACKSVFPAKKSCLRRLI